MKRPTHREPNEHGGVTLSENDVAAMARLIPEHMHTELLRYVERREHVSSFLRSVLSNDLMSAASNADGPNERALASYVRWLYNYAPTDCYGSPEAYERWIREGLTSE